MFVSNNGTNNISSQLHFSFHHSKMVAGVIFGLILATIPVESSEWPDYDLINCPAIACIDIEMQCSFSTCPAHPDAICHKTPGCGCNVGWFVDGKQVSCFDECSFLDCPFNACGSIMTCQGYPDAICETDQCDCNPRFYQNGIQVECDPDEMSKTTPTTTNRPTEVFVYDSDCPFNWFGLFLQCRNRQGPNMCDQCEQQGKLCCPHGCGTACKRPVARMPQETTTRRFAPTKPTTPLTTRATTERTTMMMTLMTRRTTRPVPSELKCPPSDPDVVSICLYQCHNCEAMGGICCSRGCHSYCHYGYKLPPMPTRNVPFFEK